MAVSHGDRDPTPAPLVSVAIATWNRAHLVGRAVRSALAQTFGDVEIIVVDDGSTDATPGALAGLDDGRLRCVRLERNGGISRARNTAIRLARGEWMAFLDDDNEWTPDYLERQLALAASRPDADVVYCRARLRDGRTGYESVWPGALWQGRVFRHLVHGWNPLISGSLIRRSALVEIGGLDEGLRATEDRDLWMRLALRTDFVGIADALLVRHERHGPQLSGNPDLFARDAAVLDGKWRAAITAAGGRSARRRWLFSLALKVELSRARRAAGAGAGERIEGARRAARLLRFLPWSAPDIAKAVVLSILGPTQSRQARQWIDWFWYRARKALGLRTTP